MCDLMTIGMVAMAGGNLMQGAMASKAHTEQAEAVAEQKETEKALFATQDERQRKQFRAAIGQQSAEIVGAGWQLDSPTALALARDAAAEMTFESQSTRSHGLARDAELTATERSLRAQASQAMLGGVIGAAGAVLNTAPTIWPSLLA